MPRAKRSQQETDAMRSRLVEAARRTIAGDGLAAVTARGLALQLGCSVGAIYTVTPRLDDITLSANAAELTDLLDALKQRRDALGQAPPADVIHALADTYLGFAEQRPKSWAAIFERDAEGEPPAWYRERQLQLFALLEDALTPLAGDTREAAKAARALWAALQGLQALAMAGHVGRIADTRPRELARYLVEVFLRGLATERPPN